MSRSPFSILFGKSPLTDPLSVGSSAAFHLLLLLLASLTAALNAGLPMATPHPKALYAEVDPVDNRADIPKSPGQGGGSPGEIGGMSDLALVSPADGTKPKGTTRDPAAETLLAEILPSPQPKSAEPAPTSFTGSPNHRPGFDSRLGFRWRWRRRRRLRWRGRARDRTRHPVLRSPGPCSLLRLRNRLFWQHGHPQFARHG